MTTILNWFKDKALLLLTIAVIAIGSFYFGYDYGNAHNEAKHIAIQKKEDKVSEDKQNKIGDVTQNASQNQEKKQEEVRVVYKTITKEVIKYRDRPESKVVIDKSWVDAHNKAACGPNTNCAPEADETTTGQALEVVTDNYQPYYQCLGRLKGLENLYNEQRAIINGDLK
ncbi:hypothetical protein [Ralstonia phage RSP15]|uniref:Rz-like spanin n=1 Tax=Ralstonia phage RSP15 TaxID=1785960 RepID=UPI00074D2E62|nr:Rz-like spanin [Ralstonia phage RSP15]BAU40041.1 hypothetical protein [Ralstonia phage RSP15]